MKTLKHSEKDWTKALAAIIGATRTKRGYMTPHGSQSQRPDGGKNELTDAYFFGCGSTQKVRALLKAAGFVRLLNGGNRHSPCYCIGLPKKERSQWGNVIQVFVRKPSPGRSWTSGIDARIVG